ncbi:MAG: helix-turn-helix domain-containing protein [Phycisphaeraceae bacterium]|nr:helix-turn-helix domain-containing protein [Phycisphaeraceae bacterium]
MSFSEPKPGEAFVHRVKVPRGMAAGDTLNHFVIGITLNGQTDYHIGGVRIRAQRNDLMMTLPKVPVFWKVPEEAEHWEVIYVVFDPRPHWLTWMDWPKMSQGCRRLRLGSPEVGAEAEAHVAAKHSRQCMFNILRWATWPGEERTPWQLCEIERLLLGCYRFDRSRQQGGDPRLQLALDHLAANLSRELTLPELARVSHLSRSRFAELFHRQVGVSPRQYLERLRIERARQMLRLTSQPIKEIAQAVGFADPAYFSNRFRLHAGRSPRRYRTEGQLNSS